ncbi:site-specific integrase [Clostridium estertheticum]|uniref:tyrosine-type recombinase/integrase n=1 Tax=Clostridium estertheticum TaxID=238834 RepID=UPI001C0E022D|nr:tyrosine-type recombinase/integrase [Clostridium estertheticum]MBU3201573.1 site-specific integrase [Clostridium estertheticum]WAG66271.1 site-specific integrase [Clostridium estertheticum]
MSNILLKSNSGVQWNASEISRIFALNEIVTVESSTRIPISPNVFFIDDFWDFTIQNKIGKNQWYYKFDFSLINPIYKGYLKTMVLKSLFLFENAFTTAKPKFSRAKSFINWLTALDIRFIESINLELIKQYFEQFNNNIEVSISQTKYTVKDILMEIEGKNKETCANFDDIYNFLDSRDYGVIKAQREEGKQLAIPRTSSNKIVSLAIADIKDNSLNIIDRMIGCMEVLLIETGMRIGEFDKLQTGKLREVSILTEEEIFYYIDFITYKTTPQKDGRWTQSFMTPLAIFAYTKLEKFREKERNITGEKYLYATEKGYKYKHLSTLRKHNKRFFSRHQEDLDFRNMKESELKDYHFWIPTEKQFVNGTRGITIKENIGKNIYYVTPHQYRATCATILYEKHYKLDWIRQHMNHLDDAMTAHYIRINEIDKRKMHISEALILRANKDGTALEINIDNVENPHIVKELRDMEFTKDYEIINKFLQKLSKNRKTLNVYKDIDKIIAILTNTSNPLIETEMGFCVVNSLIKLCERQEYISTIGDAYYLGPHIPTIESLLFNYNRFKEKIKVIDYNKTLYLKDKRYKNQYDIEIRAMKNFANTRLLPELDLLDSEVQENGRIDTIKFYKDTEIIIDNFENIKKEVSEWMK